MYLSANQPMNLPVSRRDARQPFRQVELRLGVDDVGRLHQGARLVADRGDEIGVAVTDRGHAPACGQVDVLTALDVPDARARAALERDGPAPDGRHEDLLFPGDDRFEEL